MTEMHPEGFDSVIGLSQILLQIEESLEEAVKESNISRLIKSQLCEKLFYNNADVKAHNIKVHEYGEYYNPCGDCGFMGGDATEIEEDSRNNRKCWTKRGEANTGNSYENFNIFNGDIVVGDNSDADEDWEKNKRKWKIVTRWLQRIWFFFYKCDLSSFETIFDDQFKQHKKSKHMSKSKRKANMEANKSSGKRSSAVIAESEKSQLNETFLPKASYQCKECGYKARFNYNLTRYV